MYGPDRGEGGQARGDVDLDADRAASTPSSAVDRTRTSTLDDWLGAQDPVNTGELIHVIRPEKSGKE